MTSLHRATRLLTSLALAAALAACGDDGGGSGSGDPEDSALARAIAEEMLAEDDTGELTEADARCVAGDIVGGIGEDRLDELGVTPDDVGDLEDIDFTDDELGAVADAMIGCVDVTDMLATEMAADLGDEGAACVAERLDDDLIREMMIVGFRDDEPPPAGIIDAMFECGAIADLMQAQFEAQFGAEGAQCLVDSLGEDALRAMIEASMRGETPGAASVAAVQAATVACGLAPG